MRNSVTVVDLFNIFQQGLEGIVSFGVAHLKQLSEIVNGKRTAFFPINDFQHAKSFLLGLAKEQLFEFDTEPPRLNYPVADASISFFSLLVKIFCET